MSTDKSLANALEDARAERPGYQQCQEGSATMAQRERNIPPVVLASEHESMSVIDRSTDTNVMSVWDVGAFMLYLIQDNAKVGHFFSIGRDDLCIRAPFM